MKMKPEHFAQLSDAVAKVREKFPDHTLEHYIANGIGKDHAMRWRWDLFYAAQRFLPETFTHGGVGNQSVLCDYLNDSHIDTALRKIVGA